MIYQSAHQAATMSTIQKTSPRPKHRQFQTTVSKSQTSSGSKLKKDVEKSVERCRGRCRVEWSEKHVKEGLVLVQEAQLARVVKNGPITEYYEINPKPFASGQWANVYKCRSRSTGTMYAAKYSSRNRFNTDCSAELRHEIALLSLCSQSPRVVRLHDVYETPKEIILVMEYAPGGDLQTLIDGDLVPLEGDVVHFVKQLVEGLVYLHERNIAHLDIKPQNLVMMGSFPECDVKLCDFEISRVVLDGTEVREILGTPDYVAPEILHYEPITLAADMWSLGVTTYVLLTGFSPFGGETDQETFQNISIGEIDFPEELFEDISAPAKDFIAKLLALDPNARMSAKQCLRHDWLRDAPTQASPHLRRYLSKSREVLLERVVSRENLRRAALISQATSHANLTSDTESQKNPRLGISLSQSEMCLNQSLDGSRGSLTSSERYLSPTDSQTSLNSSQTSLTTSQASLTTSQNYLLNKEQTQGLLNQAQSRSQANINHSNCHGLLSRMRSLNQIQSLFGSRSQEKLYGIKCLSKSQGVLGIYRSLECIKNTKRLKKKDQRSTTEDLVPLFKQIGAMSLTPMLKQSESERNIIDDNNKAFATKNDEPNNLIVENKNNKNNYTRNYQNDAIVASEIHSSKNSEFDENITGKAEDKNSENFAFEKNLDSLQSVESDTLTEDSDETPVDQTRMSDKDEHSESEHDEPKYSVAQLVSAFNKHQEVASKTSLEAIMTEKRVNEVTFPTGPKALRLFIPDINISEAGVVRRRKTSYKPRKNWEELRKRNEKNEGALKDINNDSENEDNNEDGEIDLVERIDEEKLNQSNDIIDESETKNNLKWPSIEEIPTQTEETLEIRDTKIDKKYKQCVNVAKKETNQNDTLNAIVKPTIIIEKSLAKSSYQKERLPNYIYSEVIAARNNETTNSSSETILKASKLSKSKKEKSKINNTVNLKDILQKTDVSHTTQKENLEKLRKRTSIAKIILNDNLSEEHNSNNNGHLNKLKNQASNDDEFLSADNTSQLENNLVSHEKKTSNLNSRKVSLVNKIDTCKNNNEKHDGKKIPMSVDERQLWGKASMGSYTRAMEKVNGKPSSPRKSLNLLNPIQQTEKIRRKSSPAMGSKKEKI